MSEELDDLEAVRALVSTLQPFSEEERSRIIRWACEKLGMAAPSASAPVAAGGGETPVTPPTGGSDIKSFIETKKPRTDTQFTAAVAYFHRFEAPTAERVESINSELLQEACRKAGRARLAEPSKTLNNTLQAGYLDKGGERGHFKINSVGENLVAMVLPDGSASAAPKRAKKKAARKTSKKKPTRKATGHRRK